MKRVIFFFAVGLALTVHTQVACAESRVWIGLTIYDLPSVAAPSGTIVLIVHEGSPAHATGMRGGDIIVEIAGRRIINSSHFICLIAGHSPGETVQLTAIREGKRRILFVTLTERPPMFHVTPHTCSSDTPVSNMPALANPAGGDRIDYRKDPRRTSARCPCGIHSG
jgi:predicted metalloprotease with PDZ domain